jgi:hypothetical protein
MPNVLDLYKSTITTRIDDKVDFFSITKGDVSNSYKELADLALLFPPLSAIRTYPRYFIGAATDGSPALYRALANDVSGDTSIGANWELIGGGASGDKEIYDLGTSTNAGNNYTYTNASVVSYNTERLYYATTNVTNAGAANARINALPSLPIRKASGGAYVNVDAGDLAAGIMVAMAYRTTFWLVVGGLQAGGSKEITDTGLITLLTADGSWSDQLNSSWIGGTITGSEDSYYIYARPESPDGIPTYEYRLLRFNGTLTPIRKVLSGW